MKDPGEAESEAASAAGGSFGVDRFLDSPTRDLGEWQELWRRDLRFPIRSRRRGPLGAVLRGLKRLARPLLKAPLNDLWDRQSVFNQIVAERLRADEERYEALRTRVGELDQRLRHVETLVKEGLDEVMRYGDALYSRVDQKLDRFRREAADLVTLLRQAESGGDEAAHRVAQRLEEARYVELERRHRGSYELVSERIRGYLDDLEGCSPILDLGCGRGEALALFRTAGLEARGVDASAEMVRACVEAGLDASRGDLIEALRAAAPESLGGVVSFHVIEHLPSAAVETLVDLAWRALRPGGVLLLETPNPESLVVSASRFWIDPTHRRPIHPERMRTALETAGFEAEIRSCQPFPPAAQLPEIELQEGSGELAELAFEINRLRDRLNEVLYGAQDFAAIGRKPRALG